MTKCLESEEDKHDLRRCVETEQRRIMSTGLNPGKDMGKKDVKDGIQEILAFHWAMVGSHRGAKDILQARNIYLNTSNVDGMTPLMGSASRGDVQQIDSLIEAGADLNERKTKNSTLPEHKEVSDSLLQMEEHDVNDADADEGNTALMFAAKNDHLVITKKLISNGARTDLKNKVGETALMMAGQATNAILFAFCKKIIDLPISGHHENNCCKH